MASPRDSYGQQPYGYQQQYSFPAQPGYVPPPTYQPGPQARFQPPPPPPPRKRHTLRTLLLTLGSVLVLIVVVTAITQGGGSTSPGSVDTTPTTSAHAAAPAKTMARIGSTIDLTGMSHGEKMAVRLVRFMRRARGTAYSSAGRRSRFIAVQFRLTDIGSAAYSDAPDNSAVAVDSLGQSYQADIASVAGCHSFGGSENIAPGGSGLGCVVFSVPRHAKITMIQFSLDSGMASDTGQWRLSR